MYLVSIYSSMPRRPPSRPSPDCLTPPNGAEGVETMPVFVHHADLEPLADGERLVRVAGDDVADESPFGVVGAIASIASAASTAVRPMNWMARDDCSRVDATPAAGHLDRRARHPRSGELNGGVPVPADLARLQVADPVVRQSRPDERHATRAR